MYGLGILGTLAGSGGWGGLSAVSSGGCATADVAVVAVRSAIYALVYKQKHQSQSFISNSGGHDRVTTCFSGPPAARGVTTFPCKQLSQKEW